MKNALAKFARLLLGIALIPACWSFVRIFADAVVAAGGTDDAFSVEAVSFLGGVGAFALCWSTLTHPIRTYVFGHELTHALWGLMFGAMPSDIRVGAEGGSVRLTKTNFLITLAPYFFPFYTFVVIVAALVTYAFLRPLPFLPLWMFLIGFTWSFHVLFTLQTLTQRQPDVKLYGRIFSWTFIFIVNIVLMLVFLAAVTHLTFARLGEITLDRLIGTYRATGAGFWNGICILTSWVSRFFTRTA